MNAPHYLVEKMSGSHVQSEPDTQLHGYTLILARTIWVVIAVLAAAPFVIFIPQSYAHNTYLSLTAHARTREKTQVRL